jgi:hypothetical protein
MTDTRDTDALLESRRSTYGDVTSNAERVAKMWNGYLGIDVITPADMMMMMALYKAYRFKVTPDYSDNINDVLGYAEIVRQVQTATGGLIDAETVAEYKAKKASFTEADEAALDDLLEQEDIAEGRRPPAARRLRNGFPVPDQTDGKLIDQWSRNRCGYSKNTGGFCMLVGGHDGDCDFVG